MLLVRVFTQDDCFFRNRLLMLRWQHLYRSTHDWQCLPLPLPTTPTPIQSSILAWEIPRIEEPGWLVSMGWQSHDLATKQQLQGTGKCHLCAQKRGKLELEKLDNGETLVIKLVRSTTLAKTHFFFCV